MNIETSAVLCCQKAIPCRAVWAIDVNVRRTSAELEVNFRLEGNISRICLTPPGGLPNAVELWRHTCFELFVAIEGQAQYHELNFAPWRQWRIYAFRGYRDLDSSSPANYLLSPSIAVCSTDQTLELRAGILLADLSEVHPQAPLRVGLSAVIEASDGSFSYWALRHPSAKPDFHHPDAFALRLDRP
jgi:hypothetical protein